MADPNREKRVVELIRPAFRRTDAEQARTETTDKLGQAIQVLTTVIAKLRDIGQGQNGVSQVVGKIVADQARLRTDVAAVQIDVTQIKGTQAELGRKLDTAIANQATILAEIAATHPAA